MNKDGIYMMRALQLAAMGAGHVSPNPMVGAVIVSADNRIIGGGFHRKYGEGHAEVNAFRSVKAEDEHLIADATMYVTLEPCSHFGKTPPCAKLICEKQVRRVVVGSMDPNPKVSGRGIMMLRESGIETSVGCLEQECKELNVRFFTAHTKHRPWILLKWAETAGGKMAGPCGQPIAVSTPLTKVLMHAERAKCDAIMVGTNTLLSDNPSLDTRLWPGNSPRPVIFRSKRIEGMEKQFRVFSRQPILLDPEIGLEENMKLLFSEHGVTSLMVEGGRKLLDSFLSAGLYDRIRIEKGSE